jgi:pSer/pThr/pTyr-binding forkhead associated (FHA) protein
VRRLRLDITEGPAAGRVVPLETAVVIGRSSEADVVIDDDHASRRHASVTPSGSGALVEDLGSTNGTFVNGDEIAAPTIVTAGDELLVGATVLAVVDADRASAQSSVRPVPPALAAPAQVPAFVPRPAEAAPAAAGAGVDGRGVVPELDRLTDRRTKRQARMAPLAVAVMIALAIVIYLGAS